MSQRPIQSQNDHQLTWSADQQNLLSQIQNIASDLINAHASTEQRNNTTRERYSYESRAIGLFNSPTTTNSTPTGWNNTPKSLMMAKKDDEPNKKRQGTLWFTSNTTKTRLSFFFSHSSRLQFRFLFPFTWLVFGPSLDRYGDRLYSQPRSERGWRMWTTGSYGLASPTGAWSEKMCGSRVSCEGRPERERESPHRRSPLSGLSIFSSSSSFSFFFFSFPFFLCVSLSLSLLDS